ncbi:MAG: nucleoside deaminase [Tissierellales bacterium]|jgi:guanine deaminase|nr:nucleoside deaminase [Tissierellales bacterium]MBN2827254.1 nucleoside deaminase [Tissierellales bacterium]
MNNFMEIAVQEALKGIRKKEGGPFGAVIVKDGEIISVGNNQVILTNDPTAHAEIVAIRRASEKLGRFDLSDCEIYTTCEPCPMCYSAIHWAKIPIMYYGASRDDAAEIGFDDKYLYDVLQGLITDEKLMSKQIERSECLIPFKLYDEDQEKKLY